MNKLIIIILLLASGMANAQNYCQRHKSVKPIELINARNITIRGDSINGDEVPCITLTNCDNIRITHCYLGNSTRVGIYIYNCANIHVDSCFVTNVATGVYAVDSYAISVMHCEGKNMIGPFPRGAFVQFNNVTGPRCRVCYNKFENVIGQCHAEDAINMYKSNGYPEDPILIAGNEIRGGGPSKTGGGIMLGDNGGSWQIARDNILVNPGQYGMAISGGHHLSIINNKIYSKAFVFSNVGLYIWVQAHATCSMNEIRGNYVNWKNADGDKNDTYNKGDCEPVAGWENNFIQADLNEDILPKQLLSPCNR